MAKRRKRMTRKKAAKKCCNDHCLSSLFENKKKKLTQEQEFDIMKMVLNKFLWLGFVVMALGMYIMIFSAERIFKGLSLLIVGAIILILFTILIVREYEIIK